MSRDRGAHTLEGGGGADQFRFGANSGRDIIIDFEYGAVGGHRMSSDGYFEGWQVESAAIECAIADLLALARTTAETTGNDEYDVRLGIEWAGEQPLTILTKDSFGYAYDGVSVPLHRYTPVETTINAVEPPLDFFWHVHDFALDCVNQGGVSNVLMIQPPARDESV